MNFLIIIPCLGKIWEPAVLSVMKQEYDKNKIFILVIQDGCAKEKTYMIQNNWKWLVWERQGQNYATKNFYDGLRKAECFGLSKTDVVVSIDGDDPGLASNSCLPRLCSMYRDLELWLTYGSYKKVSNGAVIGSRYHRGDDVRMTPWKASHLRTFRYGLALKIPESAFKRDGAWFKTCVDLASMFAMIEMAGLDRTEFIEKPMYIYNDKSPESDHVLRGNEQSDDARYIRGMPKFERINCL